VGSALFERSLASIPSCDCARPHHVIQKQAHNFDRKAAESAAFRSQGIAERAARREGRALKSPRLLSSSRSRSRYAFLMSAPSSGSRVCLSLRSGTTAEHSMAPFTLRNQSG
jgi:hypothetical protein